MLERRKQEFELIRQKYGDIEIGPDMEWVLIKRYVLVPGWNKPEIAILQIIRPGYPKTPPDNFFTDSDLRLANGALPNRATPSNQLGREWLQFSYHIRDGWKAHADLLQGHNLLTFLIGVEQRLSEVD